MTTPCSPICRRCRGWKLSTSQVHRSTTKISPSPGPAAFEVVQPGSSGRSPMRLLCTRGTRGIGVRGVVGRGAARWRIARARAGIPRVQASQEVALGWQSDGGWRSCAQEFFTQQLALDDGEAIHVYGLEDFQRWQPCEKRTPASSSMQTRCQSSGECRTATRRTWALTRFLNAQHPGYLEAMLTG